MPRLLLHICCGPCATTVIELLCDQFDVTGYFYNPNIHPEDEYLRRLEAAQEVTNRLGIQLIEGLYEPYIFFEAVRGLENEPENGSRCPVCFRQRLANTAYVAAADSFDFIATTLTVGPMKKASIINPIGENTAGCAGIKFLSGNWKKRNGFKRSCELSSEFDIYRQDYCGCLFSKDCKEE